MSSPSNSSSYSYDTSLLIIAVLLAIVFAFTAVIHLVIRLLTHFYTESDIALPTHFSANYAASAAYGSNANSKSIIDSLPLFNLSSIPRSTSSICTICLSQFAVDDKIRLLPACRHVFHSMCIDAWLKSSPSCPLCRATVEVQNMETTSEPEENNQQEQQQQPHQQQNEDMNATAEETARVSWLKDYIDRFSSSSPFNSTRFTPSPFGSMRFSNWGSRRFDNEVSGGSLELGVGGNESFRSDNSSSLNSYFASSYKWIMGETDS